MNDVTHGKVPKWPFWVADGLLIFFAYYYVLHAALPINHWVIAAGCVVLGALLGVLPYYLEYRAAVKLLEINALGTVTEKLQNLETLAAQIGSSTSHWAILQENIQAEAAKTTAATRQISEQIGKEAREFSEFMQKMNDSEKAALRLEVEKTRRTETEWLQAIVRVLDHVFALHTGAMRAGDQRFIEPITNFQNACRDTVRRLGLVPFVAGPDEPFDAARHQVPGSQSKPAEPAVVAETIGLGYTFQGRMLRPAVVRLRDPAAPDAKPQPGEKSPGEPPL